MTAFYEIQVSRSATVRQHVAIRIPKRDGLSEIGAEMAAKAFVEAAEKAGQPVVWESGQPEAERYSHLVADVVDGHDEPEPAHPVEPIAPALASEKEVVF